MKRIFTALLFFELLVTAGNSRAQEKQLTLGNNDFSTSLQIKDGCIRASSLIDKRSGCELLTPEGAPLFEFVINGQPVRSDMPIWTYLESSERKLPNGGRIVTYTFTGKKRLRGLQVMIDREYFPTGAFLRERLRLRSEHPGAFHLTNVNGRNRFIFPRYTLAQAARSGDPTEIRIGSYGLEVLPGYKRGRSDDRRPSRNLASCHMFHPDIRTWNLTEGDTCEVKGPFLLIPTRYHHLLTSYEHASQDHTYMNSRPQTAQSALIDAAQGVKGASDPVTDDDLWFIATQVSQQNDTRILEWHIRRGGYLDGETIPHDTDYETVWTTLTVLAPDEEPAVAIHEYLYRRISDNGLSRKPHFYYNTWGMQRDSSPNMREVFTEARIAREIRLAAQTGVEIFIFDDGWQQTMGDWRPHAKRLPRGLAPLVDSLKRYGITPGIWLSLVGIDPTLERARQHPEWIIRDSEGAPYTAQWDYPACDLVSDYYDYILDDLKRLTDQGIRFFKWDAINTLNSAQPGLRHGGAEHSRKERIDRYNYLLPFYVTRLMRELREYCPDVVVEIDLTEPERALIGLMPLQEGKFFWMNNGASGYGDYSTFRTKSMRNSINATHGIFPPEVLTYAVYPHNKAPYCAQRYHLNTILQVGHGLWGNLAATSASDRKYIRSEIEKARRVLNHTQGHPLRVSGKIGASPETYLQAAPEKGYALFTAFSGSPVSHTEHISLDPTQVLGVLNHAYTTERDGIRLDLQFAAPDDTREAFVLGNDGSEIRVLSSTGWLDDLEIRGKSLRIRSGSETHIRLVLPAGIQNLRAEIPVTKNTDGSLLLTLPARQTVVLSWQ